MAGGNSEKQKALSVWLRASEKSDCEEYYAVTRRRPDSRRIIIMATIMMARKLMRTGVTRTSGLLGVERGFAK
jgi:hypothetical protein